MAESLLNAGKDGYQQGSITHPISDQPGMELKVRSQKFRARSNDRVYDIDQELKAQLPAQLRPFLLKPLEDLKAIPGLLQPNDSCLFFCCLPFYCCMTTPLVKEGQIGLSWDLDKPQFLDKGWHWWLNCDHTFERVADLKEQYISHGPIHLIRVQKGKLGYALDTKSGSPMLLMAGTHYIRKAEFKWENFLDLSEPTLNLGALKMIRVDRGIVGYYFKEGELEILEPGLHVIAPPDKFGGFVSTQLQLLDLPKQVHESADYVQLEIDADVLYCIVNPKKALLRVRDLKRLIMKTALSTLAGIIRSSHLSEVAGSRKAAFTESMAKESDSKSFPAAASAPSFQQKVHDEFLSELHEYMLGDLGVEIVNIRINDLRIHEKNLASKISKESIKIAEQEAEHRLLQKEADIRTVRANNQALEIRIKAQADADEKLILVKAENDTAIAKARAQAQAIEIQSKARAEEVEIMAKSRKAAIVLEAQATAQKILLEAEAERKAKILRGEADKKYADMISTNEVGSRLATLEIQKDTLKGIEKVAFVPGLPSLLSSGAGALNIDVNAKDLIAGRSNK